MSNDTVLSATPADLRAAIARYWRRPLYQLAAEVSTHPVNLSAILRGRLPLRKELAERILLAIAEEGTVAEERTK